MNIKTNLLNNEVLRLVNNVYFNEIYTPDVVDNFMVKVDNLQKATALIDTEFATAEDFDPTGKDTLKHHDTNLHINYIINDKRKTYATTVEDYTIKKISTNKEATNFIDKQLSTLYASYARDLFIEYLDILKTYKKGDNKINIGDPQGLDLGKWVEIENDVIYSTKYNAMNKKEDIIILLFNDIYKEYFTGNEFFTNNSPNTILKKQGSIINDYKVRIIPQITGDKEDIPVGLIINKKAIKLFIEEPAIKVQENAKGSFNNYYLHTNHKWFVNKHTYPYTYLINSKQDD